MLLFFLGLRLSVSKRLEATFCPRMLFFWLLGRIYEPAYLIVQCSFDFLGETFLEIEQSYSLIFFLDLLVLTMK